jgi:hypothetical protein
LYEKGRNIMAYQYMIILWQFPFCVFQCWKYITYYFLESDNVIFGSKIEGG